MSIRVQNYRTSNMHSMCVPMLQGCYVIAMGGYYRGFNQVFTGRKKILLDMAKIAKTLILKLRPISHKNLPVTCHYFF